MYDSKPYYYGTGRRKSYNEKGERNHETGGWACAFFGGDQCGLCDGRPDACGKRGT